MTMTIERPASTGVRCGNRQYHGTDPVYHATVADVRECFANSGRFSPVPRYTTTVNSLADQEASRKAAETAARNARYAAWRTIPVYSRDRGYYALTLDGKVRFFRVERPSKGKYAGRTFVTEQASDAFHKMPWGAAADVMDAIAADPSAAALLYGQTIGHCSRCNRTLTDAESRAIGMGPDCASKAW